MLVTPLRDGMNLVAKEFCAANRGGGVLVLSRLAGAADELGGDALLIDPDNMPMRYNLVCALTSFVGDDEAAIELLGPFLERVGSSLFEHVNVDPDLDPLRDNPRFQKMMAATEARHAASGGAEAPRMVAGRPF